MIFDTMYHFLWTMYVFLKTIKVEGEDCLYALYIAYKTEAKSTKKLAFTHEPVICWVWKTRAEPTSLLDI